MNDRTIEFSLPEHMGEDTIIDIQEKVAAKSKGTGNPGFFQRRELAKGENLYPIGVVPDAIYILNGGTIRLKVQDGRKLNAMPITTVYHAVPVTSTNRPMLGARYFFTRTPVSLSYCAETPCSLYRIGAKSFEGLYQVDTASMLRMMYWMIGCSDISETFIRIANKSLGLETAPVDETQGLLRACEEFLAAREHPGMEAFLMRMYDKFLAQRKKRAVELNLDPSAA